MRLSPKSRPGISRALVFSPGGPAMGFNSLPKAWLARGHGMDVASFTIPMPVFLRPRGTVALNGTGTMAYPINRPHAAHAADAAAAHAPRLGSDGGPSPGSTGGAVNAKFGVSSDASFAISRVIFSGGLGGGGFAG